MFVNSSNSTLVFFKAVWHANPRAERNLERISKILKKVFKNLS